MYEPHNWLGPIGAWLLLHAPLLVRADALPDASTREALRAQFDAAPPANVHGAAGPGCDVRRIDGYVRVRCRHGDSGSQLSMLATNATTETWGDGDDSFDSWVTTFVRGTRVRARLTSVGDKYSPRIIELAWPQAATKPPEWLGSIRAERPGIPQDARRSCAAMPMWFKQAISALKPNEQRGVPRGFQVCHPAPIGAWELNLDSAQNADCQGARGPCVSLDYRPAILEGDEIGTGGAPKLLLRLGAAKLQVESHDYDDDGFEDLFMGLEVKSGPQPRDQPCVFTYSELVSPFPQPAAFNPPWTCLRTVDQDHDGAWDVMSYGPFVASLTPDCGAALCPERVVGPRLLGHNVAGHFDFTDTTARALLRSQCPSTFDLDSMGGHVDVASLATRLACGRLLGVAPERLLAALEARADDLCKHGAQSCAVLDVLRHWASDPLPAMLAR
jgi:hypothetical protein